jgi:HEPN superfamily AbiV-like protein
MKGGRGWLDELADIDPIRKNACRLLEDAELLRRHRRYPSAAALAVLSLEEIGKFWQTSALNRHAFLRGRADKSHPHKQASVACVLLGGLPLEHFDELVQRFGYELHLRWPGDPESVGAKTVAQFLSGVRASNSPPSDDPIVALLRGEFDRLKQACFYVGQTPDGCSEPVNAIDRRQADRILSLPRKALRVIHARWRRFLRLEAAKIGAPDD